ncbi:MULTISPECIES: condensation protein [unclassified Streptomyces]|uniref:condensation protein n=1 Tax=unclassified Streptomyces TaxID=2593676 RepID=UPI0022B6C136|nr:MULTISPECIES: condensation protein [unclassified Streptomyces]MCZ7414089.1 condensation protein [Streptomyces sp. WMMC897]MCZ7431084.1 condensation protein [Streptomyces sp. WMMC1477]
MPTERVPFPVVDEISRHGLDEREPETVHIEIHLPGRLDEERLRKAVRDAFGRHPRILMRQAPARWWHRGYFWELTGEPETEAVRFPGDTLEDARRRALDEEPSLSASPPVRIEVVDAPEGEGCVLLATLHHAALDGPACLRVLATAAELYGGADNSPAPAPVRAPRPGGGPAPAEPVSGSVLARPARFGADHGEGRPGPGNGMHIADLPLPTRPSGSPYTVNDQLLVATCLTVLRWNREHGLPGRPVRVTMPVDDRPRTADMPIGNGTRLVEVPFGLPADAADGDPDAVEALLRATGTRTRALKAVPRPQLGRSGALLTTPVLPIGVRAATARALRRAAGPWASTTLLSNLGRLPYPMDFGDAGRATAAWFSAPARMPRGVSVTTISTGGRLQLALRWSRGRLDDAAGRRLGELFARTLAGTGSADGPTAPTRPNGQEA